MGSFRRVHCGTAECEGAAAVRATPAAATATPRQLENCTRKASCTSSANNRAAGCQACPCAVRCTGGATLARCVHAGGESVQHDSRNAEQPSTIRAPCPCQG